MPQQQILVSPAVVGEGHAVIYYQGSPLATRRRLEWTVPVICTLVEGEKFDPYFGERVVRALDEDGNTVLLFVGDEPGKCRIRPIQQTKLLRGAHTLWRAAAIWLRGNELDAFQFTAGMRFGWSDFSYCYQCETSDVLVDVLEMMVAVGTPCALALKRWLNDPQTLSGIFLMSCVASYTSLPSYDRRVLRLPICQALSKLARETKKAKGL
jgi:hypothetical protein